MTFLKDPEHNETNHLLKYADFSGRQILEVGCGEGRLTWRYAAKPAMTIGIDPDRNALRVANFDHPADLENRVHFSNAQAERLPFRKETFDTAILAWSF